MILFINACVRKESRTKRLADAVLRKIQEDAECAVKHLNDAEIQEDAESSPEIQEVRLEDVDFPVADEAFLQKRDALLAQRKYDDPMFDLARQFATADEIVVAAPYWDLSFPAALKQYFEQINCMGITFEYTPEGYPSPMCRAKKLHYVTTAGGAFVPEEFGFGYVKALSQGFYGIDDVDLTMAVGFDIVGADEEKILKEAIDKVNGKE